MKKPIIITLLIIAVLTIISVISTIVMFNAVNGDVLLYMNSKLGYIYAVSYRWVWFASGILVLFWIVFGFNKRKSIKDMLSKLIPKPKEKVHFTKTETKSAKMFGEKHIEKPPSTFCTNCGKQITGSNKYCSFCGTHVETKIE